MTLLSTFTPEIEIYSIDEAFLNFYGFTHFNLQQYGHKIVKTVTKGTGIPVSMGIAPTKTLAKVANKFAKKYPGYQNLCLIDSEQKRIKSLQLTSIGDVWGIGRQHRKFLERHHVRTAYQFSLLPIGWVRQKMTITGERTWKELNGTPCMDTDNQPSPKKQICTSRAFSQMLTELQDIKEPVSTYAAICAEKLRKQHSCAVSLLVFIHTNPYREDLEQFSIHRVIHFPVPTASTMEIVKYTLLALESIYKKGYFYKKAGVIITETIPDSAIQQDLFDSVNRQKHASIMEIADRLNSGFTTSQLRLAVQGCNQSNQLQQQKLSPHYTTRLKEVIKVR